MPRKKIRKEDETEVLVRSRRRCCLCFGLNRDERPVNGQIAHIDRDNGNAHISNLAFLCLPHHNEYDSVSRQSKGLTPDELRQYRAELEHHIDNKFAVLRSTVPAIARDVVSGQYTSYGPDERSSLTLTLLGVNALGRNMVHVQGLALWGISSTYGPNIGQLDFVGELRGDCIDFEDARAEDTYRLEIKFQGRTLHVEEQGSVGYHGMNVHFDGKYFRVD